jgi:DNA-binding response OmpR family regulator
VARHQHPLASLEWGPDALIRPVLVVEDDRKIARVVALYLEQAGYRVVVAENGRGALDAATKEKPLLVILDLMLPDVGGEQVIQDLVALGDVPVIILTAKSSEEDRVAGFALGADDYVVKPFSPRELVLRVKAVLKRAHRDDLSESGPVSFEHGALVLDGHRYQVTRKGAPVNLTPSEFKVLFALASNPDRIMTRGEIVERALGYQFEGYERSVDAHIKNIRHKIKDDPRDASFILTVYGLGYKFIGKRDD